MTDVCSGRATERPGLAKALDVARDGDALVVWKLDRIGRSLTHVVGLVSDLCDQRCFDEPWPAPHIMASGSREATFWLIKLKRWLTKVKIPFFSCSPANRV